MDTRKQIFAIATFAWCVAVLLTAIFIPNNPEEINRAFAVLGIGGLMILFAALFTDPS
jgi:peptidoglycan/LPS O-acetylase OafA/YrhL